MKRTKTSPKGATRTLSEVVALTGAKRRPIQLWADAGIIRPEKSGQSQGTVVHPGSGTHRRFPESEVIIAALISPLAGLGVPTGWLQHFSESFRKAVDHKIPKKTPHDQEVESAINRALNKEGRNYLLFTYLKTVLWYDAITDAKNPPTINLNRLFDSPIVPDTTFMGLIDLNAALKNFREV